MCYVTALSRAVPQAVKNEGNDSEMNYLLLNRSFEHDNSVSEKFSFRVQTEKHTAAQCSLTGMFVVLGL